MSKSLPNKSLLSISQAADILGVSTDTLRRLDKKGKFKPQRDDNGKRYYTPKDIELLKQIFEKSGGPYTPSEAASILNISVDSLRRWEKQGKIDGYRTPSGHRRFTQEAIDFVKGTKHEPVNKKEKDIENIKRELSKVKKETKEIKKDSKEEKPSQIVRLIHSQKTKTTEVLPLSFLLVAFVIVSSLLIGIAQLAGAVSNRLLPHQSISGAQVDGQVLAVDTEGGSAVLLSQVLDENFNFSVNGYVEGSQIRSTTSDSAPLSVQSSTKVTNLNADLLDGNDFSDLPSLITGTVNNFSLTGSGNQLKLSTSTSDPTALGAGSLYFNSSTNKLKIYNGTSWENVDTGTSSLWTDGGGYVYPTDGEKLGNDSSGGSNKLSGIYLSDSSPIYFGTDNDWNASAAGSDLNFSDGSSTLVAMKDKGSYAFLNVKGKSTTGDPSTCSEGDIYYNAQDDSVRICHSGNTWEALDGSASSISFADITTGTNSSATMTIGTGASLTFSGSGTLNASSLNSLTSSQFLRSDTSDTFSSGTLSIDSGATLDVNGDLSVADTDIAFDGASTTFTFTGAATLSSSSITASGDLAVNGGDLTTNQTTFNLLNTTPTTLNIGGAATTLELGAATGTTSINNTLTVDGNTTLGNTTADTITFTARSASDLLPITDNVHDLGSASLQWADIRGTAIYQNGNQVCDNSGNCTDSGPWDETSGVVHLDTASNLVAIGDSTTEHKLEVEGAVTGKALVSLWEKGDQDILVASNSATPTNVLRITNGGNLYITGTLNTVSGNLTINSAGGQTSVDDNFVVTGTSDLQGNISDSTGNLTLDDAVDVTGDLAVNGGDITTTQTTFNLLNTTPTTLNIGGAATTLSLGAGTGTTTVNNALTVTGTLTANGDIDLGNATGDTITFTGRVDSDILPTTDNTYDLGSVSLQFAEIRGVNIYQNGNQVCDDSGNCSGGDAGPWNETTGVVHLDTTSNLVSIGDSTTEHKLEVEGAVTGKALVSLWEKGDQDILVASNSGTPANVFRIANDGSVISAGDVAANGGDITSTQTTFNLINTNATTLNIGGAATTIEFGAASGTTSVNNSLTVDGDITLGDAATDTLTFTARAGSDLLPITDNTYDLGSASLQWADIRGTAIYQNGNLVCDSSGSNCPSGGDAGPWNETAGIVHLDTASNLVSIGTSSTDFKLGVEGAVTGKALVGLNETGDQNILTASASGTTRMNLTNAGQLELLADGSTAGLTVGAGDDIALYHDGTNSFLTNTTNNLFLGGDDDSANSQLQFGLEDGTTVLGYFITGTTGQGDFAVDTSTLYVDASANELGVNTTNPRSDLHVHSDGINSVDIRITNNHTTESNGMTIGFDNDETANIRNIENTDFYIATNNTERFRIDSTGRVGIGKAPVGFLDVSGTVTGKALTILNDTGTDQNILSASASGTTVANLDRSGNLQIEGALSDLTDTVLTIDDSIQLNGDAILDSGGTTRMDFNTGSNTIRLTGSSVNITGDLAVNGGDITTTQTTLNIDVADGGTFNFRDGTNNLVQITDQGTTGRLAVSDSLQVGSTTTLAYSRFGTGTTGHSGNLSAASDVLLQDLEVDGTLFLDGGTLANSAGTASLILTSSPTTGENSLSASSWLVENTANLGKAALMVNQTKGGDLFTASQSGTTKFRIENNGNVSIDGSGTMLTVGGGTGKIDVGTVDPVYNIGGTKYATYMAGMIGVKEEVTGSVKTSEYVPGLGYKQTIDFAKQEKGSDLWLFAKATDIEKHINNLIVLLSPSENTRAWYEVDPNRYTLSIYTSRPTSVSYRITAPRFDAALWTNYNDNPNSTGFMVEDKELSVNEGGEIEGQENNYLNSLSIENTNQGGDFFENLTEFDLLDNEGNIIHHIEAFSKLLVANIKAGAIQTENLATKGFYSFQGTIDNLLITSGLVSPSVKTAEISPLPGESDVSVTLGDKEKESGFGELIINNSSGSAVARVDSEGNAEFDGKVKADSFEANNASVSGDLYAGKIYADEIVGNTATDSATTLAKIEELLKKAEEDQKLLTESSTWDVNTATNSAKLDTLTASSLYITDTALISSLSVSESFTLGSDFVIENNSINTLERPLLIQSLASAPVEIMGGKVKIDTAGNVQIDGNLFVAGRIEAKEAVLSSTETSDIFSVRLGEQRTATISSEGKGSFSSIATDSITGGENIRDSVSVAPGQTSVSIQKDWDEAPVSVLVTPTYSTQAWVSDISEKGFTINLSESPNEEQKVFWWAIW